MSQQSLASKTITKRNVAQSSVIFSVVVTVITLGVIATVAYVDIKDEIDSVSTGKSIPELIAAQKQRSDANRKQAELASQAEDLVVTMDQRVEDLKQLEEKVNKVNEQLNFVTTSLQAQTPPQHAHTAVKTVQLSSTPTTALQQTHPQGSGGGAYRQAFNVDNKQQINATGDVYFKVSWLFKARGQSTMQQNWFYSQRSGQQNQWNAKTL